MCFIYELFFTSLLWWLLFSSSSGRLAMSPREAIYKQIR